MVTKWKAAIFVTVIVLIIVFSVYEFRGYVPVISAIDKSVILDNVVLQRNELSKHLNKIQQTVAKGECKKLENQSHSTSDTGGWCKKDSKENSGIHYTDKNLANKLAEFLKGKTVGSFGDGPGRYKQLIMDTRLVEKYDAYDGAPYVDETSEGRVQYLDLTISQYGLPHYDWVISLEVAEHIPKKFESVYLDNLVRHCKEGIILSWSVPGQGGVSHVNERPPEYSIGVMAEYGFKHDLPSSETLRKSCILPWFKKNINVFRRTHNTAGNQLTDAYYV